MNQTAFSKVLRGIPAATLVLAVASVFSAAAIQAQTPANSSQSTQAPSTAAPGTKAVSGTGVAALQQNAITKYDNRYEIYGGLLYMNGQAGQNLAKRYDMGGGEVMGTYWLGSHFGIPDNRLGIAADYRLGAGTTPVLPQAAQFGLNRILVYQNILSGGVQYRSIKNRYAAIDFHALVGASHGTFDTAITGYPQTIGGIPGNPPVAQRPNTAFVGVYNNNTTPWGAVGGSIDFNYSPKVAIRLAPDLTFEHFGTETREFVSVTMGVVYRLGKR